MPGHIGFLERHVSFVDAFELGILFGFTLQCFTGDGAQFLHDVSGNSPAPSGPFIEGRTALTIGVRADYLSRWQADVAYTYYGGDGNGLSDRDFVSLSVKYSF